MIVQSGHHNHSIECTLFFPWYSRHIRYYDCDVHFVQSSAISGKEQGTFDTMIVMSTLYNMIVQSGHHNHSIECTLFFPWYSWWLYKVDITIIVSNVPCSFYIRYYDCDVHFVQSSAVSGKEQGTFDTMIVMSTLYNHQLYQGKNKVHSHHNHSIECTLFFPWYSWWMYKVYIIIIVSNVPCSFPDIADDCTKWTSQS
jgi:hypothetical protein